MIKAEAANEDTEVAWGTQMYFPENLGGLVIWG